MKKTDICETCDSTGSKDCLKCPEYDTCDNCGRRVCKYVSVSVKYEEMLWCRLCAIKHGFSKSEIESGAINFFD
jgi:hypothetical protein